MTNTPQEGDPSYELYKKERAAIIASLRRRAHIMTDGTVPMHFNCHGSLLPPTMDGSRPSLSLSSPFYDGPGGGGACLSISDVETHAAERGCRRKARVACIAAASSRGREWDSYGMFELDALTFASAK